ncbi:MAG: 2,3-epoxybenzoyl-CoA dihydrolase [Acidimicrobiales bacterium]|nr:2,3-epoxybenzoyl-CoA dihydrolase [Acidimicrobiales bacterium]
MAQDFSEREVQFETHPDRYRHWKLTFDGPVATLSMDVQEDGGLLTNYKLKLNSYDLSVDIELADAIQRIRFEHPEVHAVVVTSLKERIFCAGANIFMLGSSPHDFKVNFCKFTNETRLAIEDASQCSGLKFLAAINGICAGGGYELALACDEIVLVDDGNSAVSLPEAPLLGVLPGTGGLTRLVDKRKVRRDVADFFSTLVEGVRGKRAVEWRFVDAVYARSRFDEAVAQRAADLAASSDRPSSGPGVTLGPLELTRSEDRFEYSTVTVEMNRMKRTADLTVRGPDGPEPSDAQAMLALGDQYWPLRAFRELDAALLHLRLNEPEIGVVVLKTVGDREAVLAIDRTLATHSDHWLVREILHFMKRTLKRLDLTAKSLVALIEPGSCFAGTLLELALAADQSFMLDDPDRPTAIGVSVLNGGALPMSTGLTRLQSRFLGEPDKVEKLLAIGEAIEPHVALQTGLVSFTPDELDWDDEVRLMLEGRASLSPDALTGLEANLRFAGPETLETKIFGRLSAWQNWIFQRPNAVGERGALKTYGVEGRPEFDWRRT